MMVTSGGRGGRELCVGAAANRRNRVEIRFSAALRRFIIRATVLF